MGMLLYKKLCDEKHIIMYQKIMEQLFDKYYTNSNGCEYITRMRRKMNEI